MSRNSRSALLKKVAQLEARIQTQSHIVSNMRDERTEAERIIGHLSVALPPKEMDVPRYLDDQGIRVYHPAAKTMYLPIMQTYVNVSGITNEMHVRVTHNGKRWGYAIQHTTLQTLPKDVAIRLISTELANLIVQEYTK